MIEDEYLNPNWSNVGRIHDWRNYINEDLRKLWYTFSPIQRTAIGMNAQEFADREEWD